MEAFEDLVSPASPAGFDARCSPRPNHCGGLLQEELERDDVGG